MIGYKAFDKNLQCIGASMALAEENEKAKNKSVDTHDLVAMWQDGYNKALEEATHNYNAIIADYDKRIAELAKANEWHYVKDGDLPKDEKDMLMSEHLILLTKMKGTDNLNISLGQYNFSTQEFSYQHIVGLTDVIAWKEIVLPKE